MPNFLFDKDADRNIIKETYSCLPPFLRVGEVIADLDAFYNQIPAGTKLHVINITKFDDNTSTNHVLFTMGEQGSFKTEVSIAHPRLETEQDVYVLIDENNPQVTIDFNDTNTLHVLSMEGKLARIVTVEQLAKIFYDHKLPFYDHKLQCERRIIPGDGNCAYEAYGITRDKAYLQITENLNDEIISILAKVLEEALLNNADEHSVSSLLSDLKMAISELNLSSEIDKPFSDAVKAYRSKNKEYSQALEAKTPNTSELEKELKQAADKLLPFFSNPNLIKAYLYQEILSEKKYAHMTTLVVLALAEKKALYIWEETLEGYKPHPLYAETKPKGIQSRAQIHMLYTGSDLSNLNHFDRISPQGMPQLQVSNTQNTEIPPIETARGRRESMVLGQHLIKFNNLIEILPQLKHIAGQSNSNKALAVKEKLELLKQNLTDSEPLFNKHFKLALQGRDIDALFSQASVSTKEITLESVKKCREVFESTIEQLKDYSTHYEQYLKPIQTAIEDYERHIRLQNLIRVLKQLKALPVDAANNLTAVKESINNFLQDLKENGEALGALALLDDIALDELNDELNEALDAEYVISEFNVYAKQFNEYCRQRKNKLVPIEEAFNKGLDVIVQKLPSHYKSSQKRLFVNIESSNQQFEEGEEAEKQDEKQTGEENTVLVTPPTTTNPVLEEQPSPVTAQSHNDELIGTGETIQQQIPSLDLNNITQPDDFGIFIETDRSDTQPPVSTNRPATSGADAQVNTPLTTTRSAQPLGGSPFVQPISEQARFLQENSLPPQSSTVAPIVSRRASIRNVISEGGNNADINPFVYGYDALDNGNAEAVHHHHHHYYTHSMTPPKQPPIGKIAILGAIIGFIFGLGAGVGAGILSAAMFMSTGGATLGALAAAGIALGVFGGVGVITGLAVFGTTYLIVQHHYKNNTHKQLNIMTETVTEKTSLLQKNSIFAQQANGLPRSASQQSLIPTDEKPHDTGYHSTFFGLKSKAAQRLYNIIDSVKGIGTTIKKGFGSH